MAKAAELLASLSSREATKASSRHWGSVTQVFDDGVSVILDGATASTPCESRDVKCLPGDRVEVEVRDHRAIVKANATHPVTDDTTVEEYAAANDAAMASLNTMVANMSVTIVTLESGVDSAMRTVLQEVSERSSHIRFGIDEDDRPVMDLGTEDSKLSIQLSNEQLSFRDDAETVAYINGKALYIANAKVTHSMQFGGFAWIPRSNGNLALKWMG